MLPSSGAALENRIHPAVQAALRFFHRGLRVVADLDFGHPGAALQRQHGYGRAQSGPTTPAACCGA